MHLEAIVIGGGPGGSSAATFLARAGKRVLVLEKERFPRFHIGESLLPYNRPIFEAMGVLPKLEAAGFITKHGAQFHLGDGSKANKITFRDGVFTKQPRAIQVERSVFDDLLLKHAASCGADVREGWTVKSFAATDDGVSIQASDGTGAMHRLEASFLIDASGRGNMTGNQEGLRAMHPTLKKLAVFGHFAGVMLDEGEKGGDTIVVRLENKWFWFIPLAADKVSVGCVMDQDEFNAVKLPVEEKFRLLVESSVAVRERMKFARAVGPIHATADFSYRNKRLVGRRLLRVGDAAGFLDPIFSSGVLLAMHSGKLAAEAVVESLHRGDDGRRRLARYEKRVRHALDLYLGLVERFYTRPFVEILVEPRPKYDLPDAINAVLAGDLEGGWKLWWRMRMLFLIAAAQARFPLVPRLEYLQRDNRLGAAPVEVRA